MDDYGVDYAGLKPGLYLQWGPQIKALDVARGGADVSFFSLFGLDKVDDDTLADREPWTATALIRRAEWLLATPHAWMQGENEMDAAPFDISDKDLLPQIDRALQTKKHGAFLYKVRTAKMVTRLVWLDPDTITPDIDTATHDDGVKRYLRTVNGKREWLKAQDIIWFKRSGMKEIAAGESPLEASRLAAEILYNIARMEDSFFEANGLPIMLVMVPAGTAEAERERLQDRFYRLFNIEPGTRQVKTIAVREGVTIEKLSFTPNDMNLDETVERRGKEVLRVHQVPKSIVDSNAANYATAISDQISFANTMATRLEAIAETLNTDPDVMASGVRLEVMRDQLPVLADDTLKAAQAFSMLMGTGLPASLAGENTGIDIPEDMAQDSPGEDSDGGLITQDRVLNGAQITSAIQIVDSFNKGMFDRDVALSMMSTFFNLAREVADPLLPSEPMQANEPEPTMYNPDEHRQKEEDDSREDDEMKRLKACLKNGKHLKDGWKFRSDILSQDEIDRVQFGYEFSEANKSETYP